MNFNSCSLHDRYKIAGRGIFLGWLLLIFGSSAGAETQHDSWYKEVKQTENSLFTVTLDSVNTKTKLSEFESWLLTIVHSESGKPVSPVRVTVNGGMPMHGHGLPTQPQVTGHLGEGRYQLEGLQFNMNGQWVLEFEIRNKDSVDNVTFEIVLDY